MNVFTTSSGSFLHYNTICSLIQTWPNPIFSIVTGLSGADIHKYLPKLISTTDILEESKDPNIMF
jgi:hypothetical protein